MASEMTSNGIYPRGFPTDLSWPWPLILSQEVIRLNYGKALRESDRTKGEVPVYGTNGQCGLHDCALAKGPSVILGRKGQGPLGVEWCPGDFWVIDTAYFATTVDERLDLLYFYYLVKYIGLNHLKDGTSNPGLSRDTFAHLLLPMPPRSIQERIAALLSNLDSKIDLLDQTNATLEAIAQALFKSWFVDFDPVKAKADGSEPDGMDAATAALFPSSFEDSELGPIPHGWTVGAITDVLSLNPTRSLKKKAAATYLDMASVPKSGHRATSWIERDFVSGSKFINGDTLLARITPCLENGKTAYVDFLEKDEVGWGSTEFVVMATRPNVPSQFGYLVARHPEFRQHAIQSMSGTSGRQRVQVDQLAMFKLAVADEQVYRAFGNLVEPLFRRIKCGSEEQATLAALRDTLLPKLMSGQLRIPEAEALVEQAGGQA